MENHDHMVDAMAYAFQSRASHDPKYNAFSAKFMRRFRKIRRWLRGVRQTIFWRTMFALGIGWKVGNIMCRLGIYKAYAAGRCGYCGGKQGFMHKKPLPTHTQEKV